MAPRFRLRRPFAIAGGAMVLGAGALLLLRPAEAPPHELTPAPAAAAPIAPPPALPVAPPPVAASTAGLQLKGVLGYQGSPGAAIFSLPDGRQRLVAVGRDVVPGVRLDSIAVDRVTVFDGVQRLELMLPELQSAGGAAPPPPPPAPVAAAAPADPRRELANYRLGLKPEGDAQRPRGYRIAAGVPLPLLQQAGLRAGDVVLSVNGQSLDEERLLELPAEIAAASSVEIVFERDGQRLHAAVPAAR